MGKASQSSRCTNQGGRVKGRSHTGNEPSQGERPHVPGNSRQAIRSITEHQLGSNTAEKTHHTYYGQSHQKDSNKPRASKGQCLAAPHRFVLIGCFLTLSLRLWAADHQLTVWLKHQKQRHQPRYLHGNESESGRANDSWLLHDHCHRELVRTSP